MIFFAGCKKKDDGGDNNTGGIAVQEKNIALVNKLTGSKCPPCGGWGWTTFEEIITANGSNAIYMGTYNNNFVAELFITPTADDLVANSGQSGYPTFCANGVQQLDRPGGAVNVASEKAKVKATVDAHIAAPVVVGAGLETSTSGNTMTIKTRTKFFKNATGDHYIAVYFIENGVMGTQSGQTGTVPHKYVLRGHAGTSTFGEKITSGTTAGSTFDHTFTYNLDPSWNKANLQVVAVIWKANGGKYEFVNAAK